MSDTLAFPESQTPVLATVAVAALGHEHEKEPARTTHASVWMERLATAGGALLAMGVIYLSMR